jgi:pimeloyl-ACP methyl ester carboxylesterase
MLKQVAPVVIPLIREQFVVTTVYRYGEASIMDPPFQLDRRQFICAAAAAVAVPDGARTATTSLPILWSRDHGEGRDIVFIHGWSMDHRDEYRTYEPIFKSHSGWRRHYLDLPGMGASPADTRIVNLDDMLEILLRWIRLTLADRPFAIAGTSIGALLARGVLAHLHNRVQGVLLRAPVVVPETNKRDVDPVTPIYRDAAAMAALSDAERQELGEVLIQTPEYLVALQAKMREAVIPAIRGATAYQPIWMLVHRSLGRA